MSQRNSYSETPSPNGSTGLWRCLKASKLNHLMLLLKKKSSLQEGEQVL